MKRARILNRGMLAAGAIGFGTAGIAAGLAAGVGAVMATRSVLRRLRALELRGKRVLITGGSRGLGLAMAHEFAREGCLIAICARNHEELERAANGLRQVGAQVLAVECDVTNKEKVTRMVEAVRREFGHIDILVNNAGVIEVGPLNSQTMDDYREAMDVMFWGTVHTTLEVIPEMMQRGEGRIANITSIGGRVSVPHLVPYSSAKFAAVGFSEGIAAELSRWGIRVTTVVPGLMRTGSHMNAYFKGDNRAEYAWFSVSAANPVSAIGAQKAARRIVRAVRIGEANVTLGASAKLMALAHGIAPGAMVRALGLVNRILPANASSIRHTGFESESAISQSPLTKLGRTAGEKLNQYRVPRTPGVAQA